MLELIRWYRGLVFVGIALFCPLADTASAQCTATERNSPTVEILVGNEVVSRFDYLSQWTWRKSERFVFPKYGTEYQIRLSVPASIHPHRSGERYLFDIEVDGLSVMTGRPSFGPPGGYIGEPGSSMVVAGWRINDNQVRKFVVCPPAESLAAKNGLSGDTGRIRIRIYREHRQGSFLNIPQAPSGMIGQSFAPAGTARGETVSSRVRHVDFDTELRSLVEFNFVYSVASSVSNEQKLVDLPNATLK